MPSDFYSHPTAVIDDGAKIGNNTKIWHFAHICSGVEIGENCVFGQNTMVANDVKIGNNVKVQNNVAIYSGLEIEDDVFLGPSCVLTNVSNPRSQIVRQKLYEKTLLRRGCSIGANATIVCGISLGKYSFVAAGALVTKSLPDYALAIGTPARVKAYMSRHAHILHFNEKNIAVCPESGFRYQKANDNLVRCLDLDEESPLSNTLTVGKKNYQEFKQK